MSGKTTDVDLGDSITFSSEEPRIYQHRGIYFLFLSLKIKSSYQEPVLLFQVVSNGFVFLAIQFIFTGDLLLMHAG